MTPNLQKIVDKATDVLGGTDKALDWIITYLLRLVEHRVS